MIIYKATNLINGKCYIGKTIRNFEKYKNNHIKCAFSGSEKTFYNAMRKYGKDNFQWEILKNNINDKLMLNLMETFMITVHHSHYTEHGYNMTWGGDGGDTLSNHPNIKEIGEKISKKLLSNKRHITEKHKNKLKILFTGKSWGKHSTEIKKKIGDASKGRKILFSKEHNIKNGISHRKYTIEQLEKAIQLRGIGLEYREISEIVNIPLKSISGCIRNYTKI